MILCCLAVILAMCFTTVLCTILVFSTAGGWHTSLSLFLSLTLSHSPRPASLHLSPPFHQSPTRHHSPYLPCPLPVYFSPHLFILHLVTQLTPSSTSQPRNGSLCPHTQPSPVHLLLNSPCHCHDSIWSPPHQCGRLSTQCPSLSPSLAHHIPLWSLWGGGWCASSAEWSC